MERDAGEFFEYCPEHHVSIRGSSMDAISILALIFALVAFPFAVPAFFRVMALNQEIEVLKKEIKELKEKISKEARESHE